MGHDLDQTALIAAILAQQAEPASLVTGPEWSAQVRPPTNPGTFQDKYVKIMMPFRVLAFFILWMTWDWKRAAFVAVVTVLVIAIVVNR